MGRRPAAARTCRKTSITLRASSRFRQRGRGDSAGAAAPVALTCGNATTTTGLAGNGQVTDGEEDGLPRTASEALREAVRNAAGTGGDGEHVVRYSGPEEPSTLEPTYVDCAIGAGDILLGGSVHKTAFVDLLGSACRRAIIHSTFLQASRFDELIDVIRTACRRGVVVDVLWGAEHGDATEQKNALAALEIARRVREDADTDGRVHVRLSSTGSHAKILLVDNADGGWVGAVGSCNWLSSPFQAAELSVVLRDPSAVSQVVDVVQRMVGRRGLCDELATELAVVADDLRARPSRGGAARVAVVIGDAHDALMRTASGSASERLVIGSNRLGATARPGAIIPGEVAAARPDVRVALLYRSPSGPVKRPDARALAEEAAGRDVRVIRTDPVPLHGKFLAWDDDDVVITSLNWASAAVNPDFPYGEVGVHVRAPRIASDVLARLTAIYPELAEPE